MACTTGGIPADSAAAAMDGMVAMGMGSPSPTRPETADGLAAPDGTSDEPCEAPAPYDNCGDTTSSGACSAMTMCVPPALGADRTVISPFSPLRRNSLGERVIAPPARPTAPDHPPPRA